MLSSEILEELQDHPYLTIPEGLAQMLATHDELPFINGCGTASGIMAGFGPVEIDGLCILPACIIHDYRYFVGETHADKTEADIEFLFNLNLIIRKDPITPFISVEQRQLRFNEALILFKFVHMHGMKSFVSGKYATAPVPSYLEQLKSMIVIFVRTLLIPVEIFKSSIQAKYRMYKANSIRFNHQ